MAFCMLFTLVACKPNPAPSDGQGERPFVGGDVVPAYGIYFYTGNTTTVSPMLNIKAGSKITEPNQPAIVGSEFLGWYTDYGTYQNKFVWDTMPDKDVVLYANWKSTVNEGELKEYEDKLDATSENGHLYIHYMRFDNDPEQYAKMSLWIWPKAYTGKTFNWTKDTAGKVVVDNIGGAVCDIDLTSYYTGAGNAGTETMQFFKDGAYGSNYKPEYINDASKYMDSEIGFLIVYDDSKNSGSHWKSDGGNQYFKIADSLRGNGSIHVFATQDNVGTLCLKLRTRAK